MATFTMTGWLGKDAELRETSGGTQVCTFSAAYETKTNGEKVTHWVKGAIFGKRAAALAPHLLKGKLVEFSGTPVVSTWADKKSGEPRGQIEVTVSEVVLHGGGERDAGPVADRAKATSRNDQDDDIPF